ncbi:MAG: glycosyltransferase [Candidatus Dadabacteria bacterium]|nr:glycosyltransferase [Candidatus Dadabacteria bacterium]
MIKVSVVIPTFQRRNSVKRALTALSAQTFPHDSFEVIVSIDGSDDGTREMVEEFDAPFRLRGLWEPNSGRATACNRGVKAAEGELLIILDDDMEPSPRLVEAHHAAHPHNSMLGVIGAAPIFIDESSTLAARYIAAEFNARQEKISAPNYNFRIWDFYGANLSIRRKVLIEAGAFNELFKVYGYEDIELAQRLVKAGVKFAYSPEALCTQHYEDNFSDLARKTINGGKMAVLMVNLHPETFTELNFRNYNSPGWKWRTLRLLLIWSSLLVPATTGAVVSFVNLFDSSSPERQRKICSLAMDYLFWLGVWSAIKSDKKNNELLSRIKSYEKPKTASSGNLPA